MMKPIYIPGYVPKDIADREFTRLWEELDWERREGAPRREYWQNDYDLAYTYGSGERARTYEAKPWDRFVDDYRELMNAEFGFKLDCCFLNGYNDEKDSLGWHADDSPEMNPAQPVISLSLGAERDICFRPIGAKGTGETVRLGHGSICIMPPGFQQTHVHKIPKGDRPMGPRISLTYRGMIV
jgi:alkylated DNA repair dioxygenase AlkB